MKVSGFSSWKILQGTKTNCNRL